MSDHVVGPGTNGERCSESASSGQRSQQVTAADDADSRNGSGTKKRTSIAPIKIPDDDQNSSWRPMDALNGHANVKTAPLRPAEPREQARKLPPEKLIELTTSPDAIPIHVEHTSEDASALHPTPIGETVAEQEQWQTVTKRGNTKKRSGSLNAPATAYLEKSFRQPLATVEGVVNAQERPPLTTRTASTPILKPKSSAIRPQDKPNSILNGEPKTSKATPLSFEAKEPRREGNRHGPSDLPQPSPLPASIPLPPMSLSTFLQLELSPSDPSPLYIYQPSTRDFPYEPSRVKLERLMNFLLLPPQLEQTLWFGTLACLDSWLYTFTILPLRFVRAMFLLLCFFARNVFTEVEYISKYIYTGLGRFWRRNQPGRHTSQKPATIEVGRGGRPYNKSPQTPKRTSSEGGPKFTGKIQENAARKSFSIRNRLQRERSSLLPKDKADILQGLLIIASCVILMQFDASMMYHSIRGQAAIKLYVIYNALEVFDRLLAAIGQDVLECLFSKEALERRPDGRSKVVRPLWLFLLALVYNITHAIALFYQVITLNVAVNSYSNALLTLLMSNQFVEIKSTVFKRFEKENLFQITCADVVERFQLWLMLLIIASRNVIETNNIFGDPSGEASTSSSGSLLRTSSLLPSSFTLLPSWAGQVMGPFFLVLGIEMLVDWVKHAYITKFNSTRPSIYGRFLDVLAKDYYTYAFADQNLTKRLGLPTIPLSCLFIRAAMQSYQMFLATHLPLPLPSTATSLDDPNPSQSPASMAEMLQLPQLLRRALGRHVPADAPAAPLLHVPYLPFALPSADTCIAMISTGVLFALCFALLLALKLLLGMALLAFARQRYVGMKAREHVSSTTEARRTGGWGTVEVDEDKRRWIYEDDADGLRKLWERENKDRDAKGKGFGAVQRYSMVAKRIW